MPYFAGHVAYLPARERVCRPLFGLDRVARHPQGGDYDPKTDGAESSVETGYVACRRRWASAANIPHRRRLPGAARPANMLDNGAITGARTRATRRACWH